MSIETLKKLVEDNKIISFFKASPPSQDRGNIVCKIENKVIIEGKHPRGDSVYYLYADTFEELLNKIERKHP